MNAERFGTILAESLVQAKHRHRAYSSSSCRSVLRPWPAFLIIFGIHHLSLSNVDRRWNLHLCNSQQLQQFSSQCRQVCHRQRVGRQTLVPELSRSFVNSSSRATCQSRSRHSWWIGYRRSWQLYHIHSAFLHSSHVRTLIAYTFHQLVMMAVHRKYIRRKYTAHQTNTVHWLLLQPRYRRHFAVNRLHLHVLHQHRPIERYQLSCPPASRMPVVKCGHRLLTSSA